MVSSASIYETEALALNAVHEPLVYADFRAPRDVSTEDVQTMLELCDGFVSRRAPFLPLIHLHKGSGIISSEARRMFADWLEKRVGELQRDDVCVVVVVPEAIFRAVLRVVYRFRVAPLRTITVPDIHTAVATVRSELERTAQPCAPELDRFLASLAEPPLAASVVPG